MSDAVVCGLIGFLAGGIVGGYLAGRFFGKEYRSRIQALQEEREELIEEGRKTAQRGSQGPYRAFCEGYSEGISEGHPVDDDEPGATEPGDPDDIYLIEETEFVRDMNLRENDTLIFYQEDGVLTDSRNEVLNNSQDIIGMEALEEAETTDQDFLYVSNDNQDCMYEIAIEHNQSYWRDVMGV